MRKTLLILSLSIVVIIGFSVFQLRRSESPVPTSTPAITHFRGDQAWQDVAYQVSLGPRIPGSEAHLKTIQWIETELKQAGWAVEIQETELDGHQIKNIIGKWGTGSPWTILGAHYDSRMLADRDPDPEKQKQPVPGANDGASGVAVLLEIARVLPNVANSSSNSNGSQGDDLGQVWLAFFDAEDNGRIANWNWIMGSTAFVAELDAKPDAAVIVDMIGDSDLQIYFEKNSDPQLNRQIWAQAQALGYDQFIPEPKFSMIDDHTPFLNAGIPAADLIDFDYPYWHTTADTADKVSPQSLEAVGSTIIHWLMGH